MCHVQCIINDNRWLKMARTVNPFLMLGICLQIVKIVNINVLIITSNFEWLNMHGCLSVCLVCMLSYLSSLPILGGCTVAFSILGGLQSSYLHIVGLQRESTVGYTSTSCLVSFTCPRPPGTTGYCRPPTSGRGHICSIVLHSLGSIPECCLSSHKPMSLYQGIELANSCTPSECSMLSEPCPLPVSCLCIK